MENSPEEQFNALPLEDKVNALYVMLTNLNTELNRAFPTLAQECVNSINSLGEQVGQAISSLQVQIDELKKDPPEEKSVLLLP